MKTIAIYCVTYKSYETLQTYLQSIDIAAAKAKGQAAVCVFVADNTDKEYQEIHYQATHFSLTVLPHHQNLGYFGGIQRTMQENSPSAYDYVIISNVDVMMQEDTLLQLVQADVSADTGWIAPQIYSTLEQRDRNPKIMQRYPKKKLQLLRFLFHYPVLYYLYTHTAYKSKKFIHHEPGKIYAGHGSFIILTKSFFGQNGIIDYPVFLFCEEIYLGECCRQHHLSVQYMPSIRVIDHEHVSTGGMKSLYCKYNYQALNYIIKTYYE